MVVCPQASRPHVLPLILSLLAADVLTIENSRSDNEMVRALATYGYARDIGPGVYDVHSPVVPTVDFLVGKIRSFLDTGVLNGDATRIHVNPDCGLKTRRWEEVIPALRNMVEAVRLVRAELHGVAPGETSNNVKGQAKAAHRGCDCH